MHERTTDWKLSDEPTARNGRCAVGTGGTFEIAKSGLEPGCSDPWHIVWLPNGYAPTRDDYCICLVAKPPDEDWSELGFQKGTRPSLIEAICKAIDDHMASKEIARAGR